MFQSIPLRIATVCLLTAVCLFGPATRTSAADQAPVGSTVYHSDPQHLWNRLHEAVFHRVDSNGEIFRSDRIEPLLWPGTKYLLEEQSRDQFLVLLEEFLSKRGETLILDPLKRAILQRDLWLVFNWLEGMHTSFQRPDLTPQEVSVSCHKLQKPLAAVIGRLALTPEQIERLPDNYAAAVSSGEFAKSFDPKQPDHAYLPPELFAADGPWVCVGRSDGGVAARLHLRDDNGNAFTNSVFFVFLRLPGGREATLEYLKRLRDKPMVFEEKNISFPKLPQFPKGTEVALVRRALLIAAPHTLVTTALTESVQLRIYHEVPDLVEQLVTSRGTAGMRASSSQSSYEFRIRRSRLFAGEAGGLSAVSPTQRDFKTGFANKFRDPFEEHISASETFPQSRQEPVTPNCFGCHSYSGVYSFNTLRNFRGGGGGDQGQTILSTISLAEVNHAAIQWKQERPSWVSLRRLFAD